MKTQYEIEQRIISLKQDIDDWKILFSCGTFFTGVQKESLNNTIGRDEIEIFVLEWVLKNE